MHHSSLKLMHKLLSKYVPSGMTVADCGSFDHGAGLGYRESCVSLGLGYVGIDIESGANVDLVVSEQAKDWGQELRTTFDVVISGQVLEHVRMPWLWIAQLASLLKPDGIGIIIAPNTWTFHEYPIDCWRVWPDGMQGLFDFAQLRTIEVGMVYHDTFGVFGFGE